LKTKGFFARLPNEHRRREMEWRKIDSAPENVVVKTKIDDEDGNGERNVQLLKRRGRLWWTADGKMYVYYTPTHWAAPAPPTAE
jgi:hypothetical protein